MGFCYSTCALTGLPMIGGEPAYLQFLRPAPTTLNSSLCGQLFVPVGAPLPGTCDRYMGVVPNDDPVWAWQLAEWERLLESGALRLHPWILEQLRGAIAEGKDPATVWSHHLTWSVCREDGTQLRVRDAGAARDLVHEHHKKTCDIADQLLASREDSEDSPEPKEAARLLRENKAPTPADVPGHHATLSYAVLFGPAADKLARWDDMPEDVSVNRFMWEHASDGMFDPFWHEEVAPETQEALSGAAQRGMAIESGMIDTRRSWIPSHLQSGTQHMEFARHAAVLEVALDHARKQAAKEVREED